MNTHRIYSQAQPPEVRRDLLIARTRAGEHIAAHPARYRTTRKPFDPARYDSYLRMYGSVYGDMSDPARRAATVRTLRRRDALTVASARRQLRAEVSETPTDQLHHELSVKRYQIEQCADMRPWNIRNCDIHTYRMIINELKRRDAA